METPYQTGTHDSSSATIRVTLPIHPMQGSGEAVLDTLFPHTRDLALGCQVKVFGSHVTDGLATYNSDVDMRVDGWERTHHHDHVAALTALHDVIAAEGWTHTLQLRSRAVVPIIACVDHGSGVALDISLGQVAGGSRHKLLGEDTTAVAAAFVRRWPTLFPPLVVLLKLVLAQHNSTPWSGGIGSFKLYCLVAAFLQQVCFFVGEHRLRTHVSTRQGGECGVAALLTARSTSSVTCAVF